MAEKPNPKSSLAEQELNKVEKQFEAFDQNVKQMTLDRMNTAPLKESAPPEISQRDLAKSKDVYLKPERAIGCREKFNEDYRKDWEFDKEYVQFMAENKEIIGETIDLWTKPYAGVPAEWWKIPTNKAVWAPRYVAERVKACRYHRFVMQQSPVSNDSMGNYYGAMAADTIVQRLDAHPITQNRSVFMGAKTF